LLLVLPDTIGCLVKNALRYDMRLKMPDTDMLDLASVQAANAGLEGFYSPNVSNR
jgi:hypothetical protein